MNIGGVQLDQNQERGVISQSSKILLDAGAGSGKTRVAIARVEYLITDREVAPENIAMMTFTQNAAQEMRERLEVRLGEKRAYSVWIGTIHKFCLSIIHEFGSLLGYGPDRVAIFDQDDQKAIVEEVIKRLYPSGGPTAKAVVENLYGEISAKNAKEKRQIEDIRAEYFRLLFDDNAVDLDGILHVAKRLVTEFSTVAEVLRNRYHHMFVDEFQDTSTVQDEIISAVAPYNWVKIGDPDQCIYEWRQAKPELMVNLAKHDEVEVIQLPTNYRCTKQIVAAARTIVELNTNRLPKPLTAIKDGVPIEILAFPSDDAEAKAVAEIVKTGDPNDFAVLCRMNYQVQKIYDELTAQGIPAVLVNAGHDIFKDPDIKKILQFIEVGYNPNNRHAHRWLLNWPKSRMSQYEADAARRTIENTYDSVLDALRTIESARGYTEAIDGIREILKETSRPSEVFAKTVELLGLKEMYEAQHRTNKLADLARAQEKIVRWELAQKRAARVWGFIAYLKFRDAQDKLTEKPEGVKCMTMHGAKGLEFKHVITAGWNQDKFPLKRSTIEEERRLAYVTITRAQDKCTITYPITVTTDWKPEPVPTEKSEFIDILEGNVRGESG